MCVVDLFSGVVYFSTFLNPFFSLPSSFPPIFKSSQKTQSWYTIPNKHKSSKSVVLWLLRKQSGPLRATGDSYQMQAPVTGLPCRLPPRPLPQPTASPLPGGFRDSTLICLSEEVFPLGCAPLLVLPELTCIDS